MRSLYNRLSIDEAQLKLLLLEMYNAGLSQRKIATKLACDTTTIENWFRKFGIQGRSLSEAQTLARHKDVELSPLQIAMLDGLILSDMHLEKSNVSARCTIGFRPKEIVDSIVNELSALGWSEPRQNSRTNCWHSKSKHFSCLTRLHDKWYSGRKKSVPKDLILTPEALYWWYISDGSVLNYGLQLCTDAFKKEEVLFLITQIGQLGITAKRINSNNRILIRSESVERFIQLVGPCRHYCYRYKWEIRIKRNGYRWLRSEL